MSALRQRLPAALPALDGGVLDDWPEVDGWQPLVERLSAISGRCTVSSTRLYPICTPNYKGLGCNCTTMAQNTAATDGGQPETETHNLRVDPDTVIAGLKINSKPGEQRRVVFHHAIGGGFGDGGLEDIQGMMWDGNSPIIIRPRDFVPDEIGDPGAARRIAREEAETEDADPDEWEEEALEVWESDARSTLQEEIVVEPRHPEETRTVYQIEYVEGDA